MKINRIKAWAAVTLSLLFVAVTSGCIRSEELNAECDIIDIKLPADMLSRTPVVGNNTVQVTVTDLVDVSALAPEFTLTDGATINPPSGTVRDFSQPQIYTVTSQDGKWQKDYVVTIEHAYSITLQYNFENVRQVVSARYSYDVFFETDAMGNETMTWATANPAFALSMQGTTPQTFPCYQGVDGKTGKCAVLVTRSTGTFGAGMKKPLAAGNLFLGTFAMANALQKPLEATHFGVPFFQVPVSLTGAYKYQPGETYCILGENGKLQPVEGKTDTFNIYAVMFEPTAEMEWLDGRNVLSEDNPNIIGVAMIADADKRATDQWTTFLAPFVYRPGKSIDPEKLAAGRYSLAIVMSSSIDGDKFSGAVGSTLWVDELDLNCQ